MESIELLIIGIILVFFIGLTFYLVSGFNPGAQAGQAQLNVLAQQILQRITQYSAYNVSRDLGIADPNAPGYISDYAVDYLAMATTQLQAQACYVYNTNSQVAQTVGNTIYLVGYGYAIPSIMSSSLNLTAIARALFGGNYRQYDVEVRITPLVRLAVCPNVVAGGVTFTNSYSPICSYFYSQVSSQGIYVVAKGLSSQPLGTILYTVYYCTTSSCYPPYSGQAQLQPLSGVYSYAQIQLPAYASLSQVASLSAALVIYVQKIDYPYSAAFYVFNATPVSLIYGVPFPSLTSTTLYLIHDADYTYPNSNTPCDRNTSSQGRQSLGVRYLSVYTGFGFINIGNNITLDPGTGNSPVKVLSCAQCTSSAKCTACYANMPPDALLALVYVTPSSSSGKIPSAALVPIPLFPAPPATDVDVKTWLRWGFQSPPQTYAASAWGIFNSLTTTYLVNVTVYQYPSPMR